VSQVSQVSAHALGESAGDLNIPLAKCLLRLKPSSVLEYGAGRGKLGTICNQLSITPKRLVTIQKLFANGDEALLRSAGYTEIIDNDIMDIIKCGIKESFDLIVALDVIEHFLYSDAMSIIDYSLYRCNHFLMVWPTKYPQNSDNTFEIHRTSFELREIANKFDLVYYNQTGFTETTSFYMYHICLLRGHMNHSPLRPPVG
jgi:hypothetical protein